MPKIYGSDGGEKPSKVYMSRDVNAYKQSTTGGIEMWYLATAGSNGNALTTGAPSANVLRAFPFIAPSRPSTLDRLGINVTTGLAGSGIIGIYKNTSDTIIYPSGLIAETSMFSTSSTALVKQTVSIALEAGKLYWGTYINNAAATLRGLQVGGMTSFLGYDDTLGTLVNLGYSVNLAFPASMPTTFPTGASFITAAPIPCIFLRYGT